MAFKVAPASEEVALEAQELFRRLPGGRAVHAHAALLGFLNDLSDLEPARQGRGMLHDVWYEQVPGQEFYRVRAADRVFGGHDVCVFFVAVLPPSVAPPPNCSGVIRVLGFCWWEKRDDPKQIARVGGRLS